MVVLLERETELAALRAIIDEGGVLVIEGGAGIGKTSLLGAACEWATESGHQVLGARGSELEAGFAFGVVLQLFERRVAEAGASELDLLFSGPAAAARPLFTGQAGDGGSTDTSFAVLHGLFWLAANLASSEPLVIGIDDAQWADAPSLRWLAYLAPRLEGLRISLLVALRPAETPSEEAALLAVRAPATILHPALLSEPAVAEIVREAIGAAAADQMSAVAWHESGGNPFYLRELLRAAEAPAAAFTRPGMGLTRQVAARVRSLDARALRLGQALAVLGDGCQLRHAASVAGLDVDTAARLAAGLVRLEVLASDDPPRFLHPVLREALEASLDTDERGSAHRAAAHLLHAEGAPAGRVAAHLVGLRPAGDGWTLARLREAARAAVDSGAPQVAADLLRRALDEPPPSGERIAVLRQAAAAEALAGREASCTWLEDALHLATDSRERAEIGLELAEAHANLYHWADAVDVCERALAELGPDGSLAEPDSDAALLAARLEAELVVCGLRDARGASRALRALDRLGSRPLDGGLAETYAAATAMGALMMRGRPAEEVRIPLEAALARAGSRIENWDVRLPALLALAWAEGFDAVQSALDGMLVEVGRSGSARGLHVTYVVLGFLKLLLGALPEADAAARVALRVLQAAEFPRGLPLVVAVLSDVAVEAGQLEDAEAMLELARQEQSSSAVPALQLSAARARLRLAQGRPADALAEFEACASVFGAGVWGREMWHDCFWHIRSGSAEALLLMGERDRAIELAEAELADARAFGGSRALGRALRIAGLAHGGERGRRLLEESTAVLRRSPALLERAHSLVELGAALRRGGRRTDAREPLVEALDLAARCGARPLAARARDELKATGARPRSEWRTGVEALTPSELRVATLAAEGRTNREIAQALYVTVKTVESHLARVYGKLGVAGRQELARGLSGEKIRVPTP